MLTANTKNVRLLLVFWKVHVYKQNVLYHFVKRDKLISLSLRTVSARLMGLIYALLLQHARKRQEKPLKYYFFIKILFGNFNLKKLV